MAVIRQAHPHDRITLLTTPPYQALAQASGLFDRIETDGRAKGVGDYLRLFRRLRRVGYARVYDLHTSSRTKGYRALFWPNFPQWSGISPGASLRQTRPDRDDLHNLDRLADQLHVAGIAPAYPIGQAPTPDLGWAIAASRADGAPVAARFGLSGRFVLLAPGASPTGEAKRWPAERYGALAAALIVRGLQVAVLGGAAEAPLVAAIAGVAPGVVDLTGRTRMVDLAGLADEATLVVGNDTGPTHWAAYAGAPGLILMAHISRIGHCEPRARMRTLMVPDLKALEVGTVLTALEAAVSDL